MDEFMFKEVSEASKLSGLDRSELMRRAWRTVSVLYSGIPLWDALRPLGQLEEMSAAVVKGPSRGAANGRKPP